MFFSAGLVMLNEQDRMRLVAASEYSRPKSLVPNAMLGTSGHYSRTPMVIFDFLLVTLSPDGTVVEL